MRIIDFVDTPPTLRCTGDEGRATQGRRRRALTRAIRSESDVVVDLTQLERADPSLMVDLAMLARRLRRRGAKLLLRRPQPQVRDLIEHVGLDRLHGVSVDDTRPRRT